MQRVVAFRKADPTSGPRACPAVPRADPISGLRMWRAVRRTGRGMGPRMERNPRSKAGEIARNEEDEVGGMKSAEGRGRTLDEAVDAALIILGESRRNVDIKVLNEGPEETL